MPAPVVALGGGDARVTVTSVIASVIEAIVSEAIERMELPAGPAHANTPNDLHETFVAHLDGTPFTVHANLVSDLGTTLNAVRDVSILSAVNRETSAQASQTSQGVVWGL